jgi:hypothetical protein
MKMLAYGLVANACDEKNKIEENTIIKCLLWFVKAIQNHFESEYVKQLLWVHIDEDEWMQRFIKHVCFIGLYALLLKQFPCYLPREFINKEKP